MEETRDMKDLVEQVERLTREAEANDFEIIEEKLFIKQESGVLKYWDPVDYARDDQPDSFQVNTLQGICDFINDNREGMDIGKIFIVINNEKTVGVFSTAGGPKNKRHVILGAIDSFGQRFDFDKWMPSEEFIIQLSTRIAPCDGQEDLLPIVSSLQIEQQDDFEDDGSTTKRKSRSGVISTSGDDLPSIVDLKPFRTFRNVDQPESPFLMRYRKSPNGEVEVKLVEADGSSWRYRAIDLIKQFLKANLPAGVQIIG